MRSTRLQRFRKKYQPLIICYKAVIVFYMLIFSAVYVTTDTVAYVDHDNVHTIMITAGTWEDEVKQGVKEEESEESHQDDQVSEEAMKDEESTEENTSENDAESTKNEESIEEVVEGENDEEEKEDDEVVQ